MDGMDGGEQGRILEYISPNYVLTRAATKARRFFTEFHSQASISRSGGST